MQSYNVKVNGKSYFVEIEEVNSNQPQSVSAPISQPVEQSKPTNTVKSANGTKVLAPLPGLVLKLIAKNGAMVKKGEKILVLEAMKMEHDINAKADGKIEFLVKQGDSVLAESVLAVID